MVMELVIALAAALVVVSAAWQGVGSRHLYLTLMAVGVLAGACSVKMTPSPEQFAAIVASGDDGEIIDAALFRDHGGTTAAGAFGIAAGGLIAAVLSRPPPPTVATTRTPTPRR